MSEVATQGRSVTSMAAYEGQSGSKDRGDPEVRCCRSIIFSVCHLLSVRNADVKCLCC